MLRKCLQHGLQAWLQIQIFYNCVDRYIKSSLDEATKGSLMFHTYEQAYKIIEDMIMKSYMWPNGRLLYKSNTLLAKTVNEENEDDKFQRILNKFNRLETHVQ